MFAAGSFAKLWEKKDPEAKYTEVRISTSVKDKRTGEYSQDFGGYVRMVGQAHDAVADLEEGDSFKIVRCGVTNRYDKSKKVTYTNYVVFEIETDDNAKAPAKDEENPFI